MGSNIAGFPARFLGRHVWKPVHRCPFATSPGKVSHRPLDRLFRGSKANRATRACRWQNVFQIWMSQHNLAGQQGNLFKSQMQNRSNDAVYQQTVKRFSRRPAGIRPPSGRTFFFCCLLVWPLLLWPATRAACSGAKQKAGWQEGPHSVGKVIWPE